MISRISRFLAAGATVAAIAGTWAGVASASSAPARPAASAQTIALYCHGGTSAFLNLAHKTGPAAGDENILAQPCDNNTNRTQLLGHAYVVSTLASKSVVTGHAVVALKGGSIVATGLESFSGGSFTWAVTGGTGSYDGVHGQATVAPQSGKGSPAVVTITLLP